MSANWREEVGNKIQACRVAAELSQRVLAERADISTKYLSEIERGKGNLSLEIFLRLIQALHVEPGQLLDVEIGESEALTKAKYMLSELPEKELAMALGMLELLKQHSDG